MELTDCAFPLVTKIVQTDVPEKAFEGADYGMLIGARPRSKGKKKFKF
jgi:malate dehydrogenase